MTTTMSELNRKAASRSDRERFRDILAVQRAAHLRDGAPSLTKRRSDLKKFKAAMLRDAAPSRTRSAPTSAIGHVTRRQSGKSWASSRALTTSRAISVASCAHHARRARRSALRRGRCKRMGAYHGVEGFRTLSHAKGIFEQGRWSFIELLRAPFGSRADTLLKFFLR
jgi:hypothetical protein